MSGKLKLGQFLVSRKLITPDQLSEALAEQDQWGSRLGITLVRKGFLEEEELVRALAGQLRVPVARIRGKSVRGDVVALVPQTLAEKHRCLPLFLRKEGGENVLFLGMEDPADLDAVDDIAFQIGHKVRAVLVAPTELEEAFERHYQSDALSVQPSKTGLAPLGLVANWETPAMTQPAVKEEAPTQRLPALGATLERDPSASMFDMPDPLAGLEDDDEVDEALAAPDEAPTRLELAGPGDSGSAPSWLEEREAAEALHAAAPGAARAARAGGAVAPQPLGSAAEQARTERGAAAPPSAAQRAAAEPARGSAQRPATEAPRAAAPPSAAPRTPVAPIEPGLILRALSQLLVEKGVIGRHELAQRLRQLSGQEPGSEN